MKSDHKQHQSLDTKTELFFKALAGDAAEATCVKCNKVEMVIPLDEPVDPIFLANYHCDDCDSLDLSTEKS